MTTNKVQAALINYTSEIQLIVSCVSNVVFTVKPLSAERHLLVCSSAGGFFAVKRQDGSRLQIDINQEIETPTEANEFRVSTKYYLYSIADENTDDLVGFHYHPELTDDPILYPHIHAYAKEDSRYKTLNLHRRHIPSGRVPLEDVIRWIIDELKVVPARQDWDDVLKRARETFKANHSWTIKP